MSELRLGLARARLGPSAALVRSTDHIAACEENRLTRARQAPTIGPPDLAIAEMLEYLGAGEKDISAVAVVRDEDAPDWWHRQGSGIRGQGSGIRDQGSGIGDRGSGIRDQGSGITQIEPHAAHAEYAFRASGFDAALTVVCDASPDRGYTAFVSDGGGTRPIAPVGNFPIARLYGELTQALRFQPAHDEHLVEAMARAGNADAARVSQLVSITPDGVTTGGDLRQAIADAASGVDDEAARRDVAAAVQHRLGECLIELLHRLAKQSGLQRVCLSGGLFFNTHFTTTAADCGAFQDTYIPPHPGRSGSAVGAALIGMRSVPSDVGSPYLGPGYSDPQVKAALENCKLAFDLQREEQVISTVLRAVSRGRLVGWYHGRLEWGPRALGHRTVLADPFSPHVLDNLNGYLKKRPAYRTYGVSVPAARLTELFEGTRPSPFMQYEYRPRDPEMFRAILPVGVKTLRVHTVDERSPRYLRLLNRWGEMSGTPVLVNTSFNGFHEPLVCSPRDAIRVFYGTGLDLLALEDFILRK
jgi:carbamoyltransferase